MKKLVFVLMVGVVLGSLYVFTADARIKDFGERFAYLIDEKIPDAETTGDYSMDRAHSYIGFRVKHLGLADVPGSFDDFSGTIKYDPKKIENSSVEFVAKAASIDTRIAARDNHLKSKDFFDVEKYPELSFKSTQVSKKGKGFVVSGNLTMKGVTKPVQIPFKIYGPIKDQGGKIKMGVEGTTSINRRDFGITYGSNLPNGTPVLADIVPIDIQLEAQKVVEKQPR